MGRHRRVEATFRVLYVCTGNICRSPFAEILTRHLLLGRLGRRDVAAFAVSSAGVQAVVGSAMHPDTRSELATWGLDRRAADGFVARQLRPAMIESADLILGAEPLHRSAVVDRVPGALPFTFGLREFARLAATVDVASLPPAPVAREHALVEQARSRRGLLPPAVPEADRVPDPVGRPVEVHREAASWMNVAIKAIVHFIAPPARFAP